MDETETRELLRLSYEDNIIDWIFNCSNEIKDKIEFYSLEKHQSIPEVEVTDYPPTAWWGTNNDYADEMSKYPILKSLFTSDNIQERYWINECWKALEAKGIDWIDRPEYPERLEEEARVKRVIGEKLQTCMFAYPNTLKHYVDLFWDCGSTVVRVEVRLVQLLIIIFLELLSWIQSNGIFLSGDISMTKEQNLEILIWTWLHLRFKKSLLKSEKNEEN